MRDYYPNNKLFFEKKMDKNKPANRLEKHKTNPFNEELLITKKTKQVRVTTLGKDNNILVNQDTGEVQGTHVVTYKRVDDAEFIKLFTGNIALAFDLTSAGIKAFTIMSYALQRQIEKDHVFLDELTLENFLKDNPDKKCSMKTLYRGIGELAKAQIIAKSMRVGVYFINPSFVFNGDRIAFSTLIEKATEEQQELPLEE